MAGIEAAVEESVAPADLDVQPAQGLIENEQAALKVLYLVIRSPISNRTNMTGRTTGWKAACNAITAHTRRSSQSPGPLRMVGPMCRACGFWAVASVIRSRSLLALRVVA